MFILAPTINFSKRKRQLQKSQPLSATKKSHVSPTEQKLIFSRFLQDGIHSKTAKFYVSIKTLHNHVSTWPTILPTISTISPTISVPSPNFNKIPLPKCTNLIVLVAVLPKTQPHCHFLFRPANLSPRAWNSILQANASPILFLQGPLKTMIQNYGVFIACIR